MPYKLLRDNYEDNKNDKNEKKPEPVVEPPRVIVAGFQNGCNHCYWVQKETHQEKPCSFHNGQVGFMPGCKHCIGLGHSCAYHNGSGYNGNPDHPQGKYLSGLAEQILHKNSGLRKLFY